MWHPTAHPAGRAFVARLAALAVLAFAVAWAGAGRAAGPMDGLPPDAQLDRTTPRRAMAGFVEATRSGDYLRAAHYLDLRDTPKADQPARGPLLAQELAYVVDRKMPVDVSKLPDDPTGQLEKGQTAVLAGNIYLQEEPVPITLARVRFEDGISRWVISRTSVSMVPALYAAFGPRGWEDHVPALLTRGTFLGNAAWQWIGLALLVVGSYLVGRLAGAVLVGVARRLALRTATPSDDKLVVAARRPLRPVLAVVLFSQVVDNLNLTHQVMVILHHVSFTVFVIAIAWFLMRAMRVATVWAVEGMPTESQFDAKQRVYRTQMALLQRIGSVIVAAVSVAVVLMQFEFVRNVGVSLLASAGLAGVMLGVAAQKSLSGVIAGIQISLTQPIRIGDTVVIEKENGVIEEINLTYVVVRLWDLRRLVVPIARFLDQPFENWSKVTPELLGTVTVPVDYTTPVDRVREEFERRCKAHAAWDGRLCKLEVTDSGERSMCLRGLVSATNSSKLWTLRCDLREQIVAYLRDLDGGAYLVRQRTAPADPRAPHAPGAEAPGDDAAAAP